MKLRSLFGAVAGALLLTAAFVPRANADTLIVYFNFEDATTGGAPDFNADCVPGTPGCGADSNTGGGIQNSTLSLVTAANFESAGGLLLNRSTTAVAPTNDQDPALHVPPSFNGQALLLNDTINTTATLSFTADTTLLSNLSLSFATDNNGNGYSTVQLSYTSASDGTVIVGSQSLPTMGTAITTFSSTSFPLLNGANGDGTVTFTLTFTGGQSNGQDRQTVIDNIQLTATVVPEPATVAGGLLGLCGLCWHQRRRIRLLLPRCGFRRLRRA
jgi:hypothetical protein